MTEFHVLILLGGGFSIASFVLWLVAGRRPASRQDPFHLHPAGRILGQTFAALGFVLLSHGMAARGSSATSDVVGEYLFLATACLTILSLGLSYRLLSQQLRQDLVEKSPPNKALHLPSGD
ncbi:MAG: hypothetical protein O7H41_15975 [Planctomycetota bacterium]|nr:hypothetical protein [Planctomycetota bacterium]